MDDDDDDDILFAVDLSAAQGHAGTAAAAHPAPQHPSYHLHDPGQYASQGHEVAHIQAQQGQTGPSGARLSQQVAFDPTGGQLQQYQQNQHQPQQHQQLQNSWQQPRRPANQATARGRRRSAVGQLSFAPTHAAYNKPVSVSTAVQPQAHAQQLPATTAPLNSIPEQPAPYIHPQHHQPQPAPLAAIPPQQSAHPQAPLQLQPAETHPATDSQSNCRPAAGPSSTHAAPEATIYNNSSAVLPSAAPVGPADAHMHPSHAHTHSEAADPKHMSTMLQEMTRLANENTALKDRVRQHTPAAASVLADNASLRAAVEGLEQQLKVKSHEFAKQQERLQEQTQAAAQANQQAALAKESAAATAAPAPATLAHAAAPPHDACKASTTASMQCVAGMLAQHSSSGLRWPTASPLPRQRLSVAQVVLMSVPHSIGVLSSCPGPNATEHACSSPAASALQGTHPDVRVLCSVSVTLRAALTGAATAHAVLEQLIAALPAAVLAAAGTGGRGAAALAGGAGPPAAAAAGMHGGEAAREGKQRLAALWLVLAAVIRYCAVEHSVQGATPAQSTADTGAGEGGGGCAAKPTGACSTVTEQLERLAVVTGAARAAQAAEENRPQGANGGAAARDLSAAAAAPQALGVSADVAVKWLQGQTTGGGHAEGATGNHSSVVAEIAARAMRPMCDTLRMTTHETHALETLFAVLMFAEALVDTLDVSQMCVLRPFLFSASFMRALQPPSLRQLHQNCHDISRPHPVPPPGQRRSKGLCPPPAPEVHAIILHTYATHATASRVWAKCTCSHDLCTAFSALGEENEDEGAVGEAAQMHGAAIGAAVGPGGVPVVADDAVSWVDIADSLKACVTMSQACMDSMLEHAAHLHSTGSHCDSVCGSCGDLGSDLDRHTVQMLLDSSKGIATAGARAAFEAVARLADSGCAAQLEYLMVAMVEQSGHEEQPERPPDTLLYRLLVVACDAVANMYDTARPEASPMQQHAALKGGRSLARPRDVGALMRGSSRHHKGLQTLNELLWKRVRFPEEREGSDAAMHAAGGDGGGIGGSAPQKRARDGSQVLAKPAAGVPAGEVSTGVVHAEPADAEQGGCEALSKDACAAVAGGVPPPTAAAQVVRAVVWQRLLVATEALVLLRKLALMKSAAEPWRRALGQHVLRTMLFNPHCLLRLEAVIQRVVAMEHWPPFTYAPVDTGEPWAAPAYSPWATAFLSQHDRHIMHGRVAAHAHERCNVADLTKSALFWRKQLLHNRPEAYGGKLTEA